MSRFIDSLKARLRSGDMLVTIVAINVAVFVVLHLIGIGMLLTRQQAEPAAWLGFFADANFTRRPWGLITYMFTHYDLLHLLFNMLWLWWFGKIFLELFSAKQMLAMYLYGGLGGAALYAAMTAIFPALSGGYLIGASAAVIAVFIAVALRIPDYEIGLLFFGAVKLKWIAVAMIALDILMPDGNIGGHISHLGGAVVALLFHLGMKRNIDITRPLNAAIDGCVNLFRRSFAHRDRQPRIKRAKGTKKREQASRERPSDIDEMDIILDKIKKSGYAGLTDEEKEKLFSVSSRLRQNHDNG